MLLKNFNKFQQNYLNWDELPLSWRRPLSYRNQSVDLFRKSMGWFLYDNGLCHERVKSNYGLCYTFSAWYLTFIACENHRDGWEQEFPWNAFFLLNLNVLKSLSDHMQSHYFSIIRNQNFSFIIRILTEPYQMCYSIF